MLLFRLSMPNVSSWNGRWSGEGREYTKLVDERQAKHELKGSYYYDFGDGWGARIDVTTVTGGEVAKIRKRSDGFCGYDWMVDSILRHGEITTE